MKKIKKYATGVISVIGVLALGAAAIASPGLLDNDELSTWVSPGLSAMVDLDDTLDVTLHFDGPADMEIEVAVEASSGSVDPSSGSVTLNPQGKAAFDVVYTPAEVGDHTVTFSSDEFDDVVVNVKVNPAEEPVEEEEPAEPASGANHGQCVAGWAQRAKAEGLERKFFGEFVSTVAGQVDAVADSKDDIISGSAPESCDFEDLLAQKLEEQENSPEPGAEGKAQGAKGGPKAGESTDD